MSVPQLPDIEILGELGRGSHSHVYRATFKGSPCAVKVPSWGGRWTKWIFREAVALARVRHPGLPTVLHVGGGGGEGEGVVYLVMELVEGETLAERIARGPLALEETIAIGIELAEALRAVHTADLVHRDVKPRNIIIGPDHRARLVDFGFAAPLERLFARKEVAGSPRYAAPEQFDTPSRVDGRSDLFGLGRVLIECLTGAKPTESISQDVEALLGLADCQEIFQVLATMVEFELHDRYPDAAAVVEDLRRVQAGLCSLGPSAYEPLSRRVELVGRTRSLAELEEAWQRVVGSRAGFVVALSGLAGSGKTTLMRALAKNVRARNLEETGVGVLLESRGYEGDAPLAAMRRFFQSYRERCGRLAKADREASYEALRNAATPEMAFFFQAMAPDFASSLDVRGTLPTDSAHAFADASAEFILRFVQAIGPTLICIDDVHLLDAISRDVFSRLAQRSREAPLLLLATVRSDDALATSWLTSFDPAVLTEMPLRDFENDEAALLIANYLGVKDSAKTWASEIASLSAGTPLSILEVLEAHLDVGAVRPQGGAWLYDEERARRIDLDKGTRAFLDRRIEALPAATARVVEVGALFGFEIDAEMVARALCLTPTDLEFAFFEARGMGVLERNAAGEHRFVHETVREMVIGKMSPVLRRDVHQRLAGALDESREGNFERACAAALHYAQGHIELSPERAWEAARDAAFGAHDRCDYEASIGFFRTAEKAALLAGVALSYEFHRRLGEAQLGFGDLEESLRAFEAALPLAEDRLGRARTLSKIAWTYQQLASPDRAWEVLERAFETLGLRMPSESMASVRQVLRHGVGSRLGRRPEGESLTYAELEQACEQFYQAVRLSFESGKVVRMLQGTLECAALAQALRPGPARARALVATGIVLGLLGLRASGKRLLAEARATLRKAPDRKTSAFLGQMDVLNAFFGGSFATSLQLLVEHAREDAVWLENYEFCGSLIHGAFIESLRGRATESWEWVAKSLARLRGSRSTAVFARATIRRAREALSTLNQEPEDRWLARQLATLTSTSPEADGFDRIVSWGPNAKTFLERDDLGEDFEAFVTAFQNDGHKPASAHPVLVEYYIAVAHARVHQCLRGSALDQLKYLRLLREASHDLKAAARFPLMKAHARVIEGYVAWFDGFDKRAKQLFAEAEDLARRETAPWVLYAAARGRAHMLRKSGNLSVALDHARMAEALALEHGAAPRARRIREEFELSALATFATFAKEANIAPDPAPSIRSRSSLTTRRQLGALVDLVKTPLVDLEPDKRANVVLGDLIRALGADRGLLAFHTEATAAHEARVGRTEQGEVWAFPDGAWEAILDRARKTGDLWPSESEGALPTADPEFDMRRILAVPLFLHEQPAGGFVLARPPSAQPFTREDRALAVALSHQIPVALEVARLFLEREELRTTLVRAEKMEALGNLAGSVAHDFNNMLAAMMATLDSVPAVSLSDDLAEVVQILRDATHRAAHLTRQLLGFSRQEPSAIEAQDINVVIAGVEPLIRRLLGPRVTIESKLDVSLVRAMADANALGQTLVNLAINARDAMPEGGTVTLSTRNVWLREDVAQRGNVGVGEYALIEVSDTGHGMSAETMTRAFDPFFTTKGAGKGTGLGLSTAYANARKWGGFVDVLSKVGVGTTFRFYLPKGSAPNASSQLGVVRGEASVRPVVRPAPRFAEASVRVSSPLDVGDGFRLPLSPLLRAASSARVRDLAPVMASVNELDSEPPPSTASILIVDDDDLVRQSIVRALNHTGYRIVSASNCARALEVCRGQEKEIRLAILDVNMPGMTGPEVAEELRKHGIEAKILFVSGLGGDVLNRQEENGRASTLQKPFSSAALLGRVRSLIEPSL